MNEFDATRSTYEKEAREKWGETAAWAEYTEKSKNYTREDGKALMEGMDSILGEFSLCMKSGAPSHSQEARALVNKLQEYITAHFYNCTDQILAGLGQMYTADERFRTNIDRHGEGTAEYISRAIRISCQ